VADRRLRDRHVLGPAVGDVAAADADAVVGLDAEVAVTVGLVDAVLGLDLDRAVLADVDVAAAGVLQGPLGGLLGELLAGLAAAGGEGQGGDEAERQQASTTGGAVHGMPPCGVVRADAISRTAIWTYRSAERFPT